MVTNSTEHIYKILKEVCDPEIPALSIVDLGIVRNVGLEADKVVVTITPTYSGCPAMKIIEDEISAALRNNGYASVEVKISLQEVWTTQWITSAGKNVLREHHIVPPKNTESELLHISLHGSDIPCPYCASTKTKLLSEFGSTACKSYYTCSNCLSTFEYFKPL